MSEALHITSQPEAALRVSKTLQKDVEMESSYKPISASKIKSDIRIEHWEKTLLGKRMVKQDAPDDDAYTIDDEEDGDIIMVLQTFRRSDLPAKHEMHPGSHDCSRRLDR